PGPWPDLAHAVERPAHRWRRKRRDPRQEPVRALEPRGRRGHRALRAVRTGSLTCGAGGAMANSRLPPDIMPGPYARAPLMTLNAQALGLDRKSTRLNSSHVKISYAVFC